MANPLITFCMGRDLDSCRPQNRLLDASYHFSMAPRFWFQQAGTLQSVSVMIKLRWQFPELLGDLPGRPRPFWKQFHDVQTQRMGGGAQLVEIARLVPARWH